MRIKNIFFRKHSKSQIFKSENLQLTTDHPQLLKGFTLIELLIVIMIMALIFGLGFANYRDFQRRQVLEAAVRLVIGDLRFAQEQAISGRVRNDTPDNVCEPLPLWGYYFRRDPALPTTTYLIEANCPGAVCPGTGCTVEVKRENVQAKFTNVSIFSMAVPIGAGGDPAPANTIRFKTLGQGTNISRASPATIRLCLDSPTPCASFRDITVTWSGEIQ